MSAPLPFALPDMDAHPDGALVRAIGKTNVLRDAGDLARRRSEGAYRRWVRDNCREAVRLDDLIAATPARTPEGLLAKVEHALRHLDPEEPQFQGLRATALSALWDVLQSGVLR